MLLMNRDFPRKAGLTTRELVTAHRGKQHLGFCSRSTPWDGSYPEKANWMNGCGVEGQPMLLCPHNSLTSQEGVDGCWSET